MKKRYNKVILEQLVLANPKKRNTEIAQMYNQKLNTDIRESNLRKAIKRIREELNITNPYARSRMSGQKNNNKPKKGAVDFVFTNTTQDTYHKKETADTAYEDFTVCDGIVTTLSDALKFSKVDLSIWEVKEHTFNTWTTSAKFFNEKTKEWEFKQINNVQVKIWFKKIESNFDAKCEADLIKKLIEENQSTIKALKKEEIFINNDFNRPVSVLISMTDFHLDKRTLDGKTIYDKVILFEKTVDNLLQRAYKSHNIEEIVFMGSSDFLHTDTYFETTVKGTGQQSSVSWHDAYEIGFNLYAKTISKLKQFCKTLHVIHVPSNHSKTKEYYMMHGLATLFKNDKNIIFDRSAEPTKVYRFGNCMLGFHHGDVKNFTALPNYFASKYKKEWGESKHIEILTGDKHHKKEFKQGLTGNEINGTRMYILPSMSGQDTWHKDSLYDLAIQASVARVYDKEKGFCAEFEERI